MFLPGFTLQCKEPAEIGPFPPLAARRGRRAGSLGAGLSGFLATSALRLAALSGVLPAIACSPVRAATLSADRACYREGEPVSLTGAAFSPGGIVDLSRDGIPLGGPFTADARGNLAAQVPAPGAGIAGRRSFSVTATDRAAAGRSATLTRLVSRFDVRLRPSTGRASLVRRIDALGFTGGGTLYAHVVRGRTRRTVLVGRLAGACGSVSARKRLLRGAGRGAYRVQFDTRRRYSRRTVPRVTYRVPVFRRFLPSRSARGHTSTSG